MTNTTGLRPIPWAFLDHEFMKRWIWRTEHFEARITADVNSFYWDITDLITSKEGLFLTEGRTRDFAGADAEVREAVGKSYPAKYGYAPYAGALATTFTILTGERVDFGAFGGSRAIVTVRMPNGTEQSYAGSVRPVHYEIHLTPDTGQAVRIQPAHIVRVAHEGGARQAQRNTQYTGVGRLYKGMVTRGCNGRPGFLPETVDHVGDACAIHEDAAMGLA